MATVSKYLTHPPLTTLERELLDVLKRLVDWDAQMGHFEAPVWRATRKVIAKAEERAR